MIGTIIEFCFILIAHAAVGIYSSTLKYSKKITYIIWGTWIVLQTAILCYTEIFMKNWPLQLFFEFIITFIGQYAIFFITTKGKIAQRIFTILTYSIFFTIITSSFIPAKDALSDLHWSLTVLVQGILLSSIVFYFLRYVCTLCRVTAKNIDKSWFLLIFADIIFLIAIILSSVFPVKLNSFDDPAFFSFICLSISILAVYPVIFSSINHMSDAAEKRAVETQNKLLIAQIEAETAQLTADSQSRHDRRHHNLIMLGLARNGDFESLKEYLANLVDDDNKVWGETKYCENTTVNMILTMYKRRAKENDISVKISAKASNTLTIPPQDLVIVIANLFENAINATEKLKGVDRNIDIKIKDSPERLLIKIDNPCKQNLTFDETLYGIGIRSVITTTNKYEGMYDFTAEEGVFSAKIILNLR